VTTEKRMRRRLATVALVALAHAGAARAGQESGLSLGARAGYAIPVGDASAGISLGDVVAGLVPVQLDAAWRLDPSWRLGLYFQYGFARIAGAFCPAGASCSGGNFGLGAQAAYTFATAGPTPWIGAGLGLEWQTATVSASGARSAMRLFGLEMLDLQAGADWRLSPGFALGPFASFGLGQYRTVTSGGASASLATALHGWLRLGVKGTFDL
jgi:hypothetical protein